ncbi:86_t:CDS:2 [Diversispora eburnea]|uniref:86_t:CDS:1 n=1 Tax=Diversispora eburnea TaxID=1213867 RepID=A0A9N8VW60_9GLOM|nr:86_t:CDS:2 [Diversispora eburnea]
MANVPSSTHGSRTMTILSEELTESDHASSSEETNNNSLHSIGTLKLRGANTLNNRKVKWDNGVIDNEGMSKRKSKKESSSSDDDHDHNHKHKRNNTNAYERQPQYKNKPRPVSF